jgi:hypothetical protein
MTAVQTWARDGDYRVRRLASESTRPTLPWSPRISLPADAGLPVLDHLYADSSRYVTQSVANHLRDIAATDPNLVLATLTRWKAEGRASGKEFDFIAREALKTRLKERLATRVRIPRLRERRTRRGLARSPRAHRTPRRRDPGVLRGPVVQGNGATARDVRDLLDHAAGDTPRKGLLPQPGHGRTRSGLTLTKKHLLRSTGTTAVTPGTYALAIQVNGRRSPAAAFQVLGHRL